MNNPYLVCSDRELRALPAQWLHAERWDKAGNLLYNLEFMDATVGQLGIDELLQEYTSALRLLPEGHSWRGRLLIINKVLDRQAHNLRGLDAESQPAFFLQQLRNESFELNLGDLTMRAEEELALCGYPYLRSNFKGISESPERVRTLTTDTGEGHVAMTADGRLAISITGDNTVQVWDVTRGRKLRTLERHRSRSNNSKIHGVALSSDGRLAISASKDHTISVWDLATGSELRMLRGCSDWMAEVALSADGRMALAVAEENATMLRVWDVATGCQLRLLRGHRDTVNCMALSDDGNVAVSGSEDGVLKVWDVETGKVIRTRTMHNSVTCVAMSAFGQLVTAGTENKNRFDPLNTIWTDRGVTTLKVWDVVTGHQLFRLKGTLRYVSCVAMSADGRLVAFGTMADERQSVPESQVNALEVWEVASGRELGAFNGHAKCIGGVAISADGKLVVSASSELKVWDISTLSDANVARGREEYGPQGHTRQVSCAAVSADGQRAISGSEDGTLKIWYVKTGYVMHTIRVDKQWSEKPTCVALSADGRLAVSTAFDCTVVWVWDVERGQQVRMLQGCEKGEQGVALSADGKLAVSYSADGTLNVWDVATGRKLRSLKGPPELDVHKVPGYQAICLTLTADGRQAVSIDDEGILRVWDVAEDGELRAFHGDSGWMTCVAINADGQLAVSAAQDSPVLKVWNVATGSELLLLQGYKGGEYGVAMSADGKQIVSTSWDQILKVWDISAALASLAGKPAKQSVEMEQITPTILPTNGRLTCCAITSNGKIIVAGDTMGEVHFWELVRDDNIL